MNNEQYTGINFNGQTFYIGIDIDKKRWSVSIRTMGLKVKDFVLSPGAPKELKKYLDKHYKGGNYIAVYEAGYCGFWIARELEKTGINCMVVNPADIPTTHKEKVTKTDKNDSRKLSLNLEKKEIKGIYIPMVCDQALRSLCRLRVSITRDITRIKNRIKGFLYLYGYEVKEIKSNWSKKYIERLRALSIEKEGGETLGVLLSQLTSLSLDLELCTQQLKEKFEKDKKKQEMLELLMTVPGIGFVSGAIFVSEIIDIERFKNFDHFASFVGIVPKVYSSGDKDRGKGKSPRGNKWLCRILIESSWVAVKKDPALLMSYSRLVKRKKSQEAIIRIAKKILRRIYHILKTKTPYKEGIMNLQVTTASYQQPLTSAPTSVR